MKYILLALAIVAYQNLFCQEQLSLEMAYAYKNLCSKSPLDEQQTIELGLRTYSSEYLKALEEKDEFTLHKFDNESSKKYEIAVQMVKVNHLYFVTEENRDYTYDFASNQVVFEFGKGGRGNELGNLDQYTEGSVYKNHRSQWDDWSTFGAPEFRIANDGQIPKRFDMPLNIAEESFGKRKGDNRPPFKIKYYFKFFQCNAVTIKNLHKDVQIYKVELIDDITGYSKAIDIETENLFEPSNSNNQNNGTISNNVGKVQNTKRNLLTENENAILNYMKNNKGTDSKCKQINSCNDFLGKYLNAICKRAYIEITEDGASINRMKVKRKPCIGIFGANNCTYKIQDNYLIFQTSTTDYTTKLTKVNTTIFYLDNNSDLMVYDFLSQPNKADDLTIYKFERQK